MGIAYYNALQVRYLFNAQPPEQATALNAMQTAVIN